uniref:Putative glutathione S-transferase omega class member 5 n=1 Tax=Leptinotarsa decemlineata TaxID=7539 RepID=A0A1P8PEW1_LEPDE|nr:putative glutathione S-transferase omega class member 5 [Leptinotarsa decemlineata]
MFPKHLSLGSEDLSRFEGLLRVQIHPGGEVPTFHDGSNVLVQSLDICDYLDEPEAKNRDKELIGKIGSVTSVFVKCCYTNEEGSASEC